MTPPLWQKVMLGKIEGGRRRGKNLTLVVCFLLLLRREKKFLTLTAYFLCLETLAFLLVTLSKSCSSSIWATLSSLLIY